MRKQRTFEVRILDRPSRSALFASVQVHRSGRIVLNPSSPSLFCIMATDGSDPEIIARLQARLTRLAGLLSKRTFREATA
jgi:hypothetical protein